MTDKEALARAADDLVRLSNMFRGLLQVGEHIKSIVSLDQAADEAERRLQDAAKKHDATHAQIAVLKDAAKADIERMHKDAEAHLDLKLVDKRSALASIQKNHDLVSEQLGKRRDELSSVSAEIAKARAELDVLGAQIMEKIKELNGVQQQHKALVASITNIK